MVRFVRGKRLLVLTAVGAVALVAAASTAGPASAASVNGLTKLGVGFNVAPLAASVSKTSPGNAAYSAIAGFGSAIGNVTANVTAVNFSGAASGCLSGDFTGFTAGNIALINRGTCTFATKVTNAESAGAVAVIIANNIPGAGPVQGTLGTTQATVPVAFVSYEDGQSLLAATQANVTVSEYTTSLTMSFTVNRGPKAIRSISCTFDSVANSCGTQTSTKNSVTYTVPLAFGAGSHTFTVSVVATDGGSDTESFTFTASG